MKSRLIGSTRLRPRNERVNLAAVRTDQLTSGSGLKRSVLSERTELGMQAPFTELLLSQGAPIEPRLPALSSSERRVLPLAQSPLSTALWPEMSLLRCASCSLSEHSRNSLQIHKHEEACLSFLQRAEEKPRSMGQNSVKQVKQTSYAS